MKKYINKLFEWLGYVPKCYKEEANNATILDSEIWAGQVSYIINSSPYEYFVCAKTSNHRIRLIKRFCFRMHDADSQYYARICAEELCEMLNEKV